MQGGAAGTCSLTPDAIAELFDQRADTYDASASHRWQAKLAAEMAAPAPDAHVLDVACGTGLATLASAQLMGGAQQQHQQSAAGTLTGVDISEGMLSVARQNSSALSNVRFVRADAAQLPFASNAFDVVLVVAAQPYLPDVDAAITEWKRVLRPGRGRIVLTTLADDEQTASALLRAAAAQHGIDVPQPNAGLGSESAVRAFAQRHALRCDDAQPHFFAEPVSGEARPNADIVMRYGFADALRDAPESLREKVLTHFAASFNEAKRARQGGHKILFTRFSLQQPG